MISVQTSSSSLRWWGARLRGGVLHPAREWRAVPSRCSAGGGGREKEVRGIAMDFAHEVELDPKTAVGGGVQDVYGEDAATEDTPITPWTVSVARSFQEDIDQQGRHQQSFMITAPKYHKHYILPVGGTMLVAGKHAVPQHLESNQITEDIESIKLQFAVRSTISGKASSFRAHMLTQETAIYVPIAKSTFFIAFAERALSVALSISWEIFF